MKHNHRRSTRPSRPSPSVLERIQVDVADIYNARQRSRLLRRLRHRADTLGFALVNRETGEVLGGSVS